MEKLFLTVKANAKENKVIQISESQYRVLVKAPPAEGRANQAVIEVLSDYFGKPKSSFSIRSGQKSKQKTVIMNL